MVSYITLLALTLACRVASDSVPTFGVDDNTAANCVEWYNNAGRETCDAVLKSFGIPRQDFHEMNPSVALDCQPFNAGQSFCLITQEKLDQFITKLSSSSIVKFISTSSVFSLGPSPTTWSDSVLVTSTPVVSTTTTTTGAVVNPKTTSSVKTGGAKRNMPMFWKD